MLVYSPDRSETVATGANLIDIEGRFGFGGSQTTNNMEGAAKGEEAQGEEDCMDTSGNESDESMNRLLHGRRARNPYQ